LYEPDEVTNKISELVTKHQSKGEKLSSSQDFTILNNLLANSLIPLEAETEVFREWLGEVMTFSLASRRKPSEELITACFAGLCGEKNVSPTIIDAGVDRDLVFTFLNKVCDLGSGLETAQTEYICRRANRTDQTNLTIIAYVKSILGQSARVPMATRTARYWLKLALKHKEWIISNYFRLLYKTSAQISHASGGMVEQDAAFGEAFLATDMAVNRFHPAMGVFAGYLAGYLKGGSRLSASQALGLATPGARITSAEAIQTETVDGIEIPEKTEVGERLDPILLAKIDAVSSDPDIRAALMLSDVVPPTVTNLEMQVDAVGIRRNRRLTALSKPNSGLIGEVK
jgi:hypothetical protein